MEARGAAGDMPLFPAIELDDLLAELRSRAGAARAAHDRMRGLLDAVLAVTADLELPTVLRRIVEAACQLTGAQYGALGVIGEERRHLIEFVTAGLTPEQRSAIGDPPHGHGVLGLLIDDPRPVRLTDISQHPRSYGFPPNHPPMRTFLGMPVLAGGHVFGNLYLAEKEGGRDFTPEDEELMVGLAAAAGSAVDKARLYAESERRRRWLEATAEISTALLSRAGRADVLSLVARRARETADADLAAVLLASTDEELVVEVADGAAAADVLDRTVALEGVLAAVVGGDTPLLTDQVSFGGGLLERVVLAPLRPDVDRPAVLLVGWSARSTAPVGPQDVRMLGAFAQQAGLALELARAQSDRARIALYEDRDRIARDLHDSVVQRLFAVGLSLRGVTRGTLTSEQSAARAQRAVDDLDVTVKDIRQTIFKLHRRPGEGDLAADLEEVAAAGESALGFAPDLQVSGATGLVPPTVAEHVLAVVREGLSNVARHAGARAAVVAVDVGPAALEVRVVDDGQGIRAGGRRSGLINMEKRAVECGGRFSAEPRAGGGTELVWSVPLPQ